MNRSDLLAEQFEESRNHLRAVAYRMLGSTSEADDAVQEAWLRLSRSDTGNVDNLAGWLTTVVSRVCLDMLRSRGARREVMFDEQVAEPVVSRDNGADPEHEALLADAIGPALLVVLEALGPSERLAFVLHDMFAVPFDEIAAIVGCSPAAARQYASRARRRVQGVDPAHDDTSRKRAIVDAFLDASRNGEFEALLTLLDPEVVLRADTVAVAAGAEAEVRGALAVAGTFSGRARVAKTALIDGIPGAVWAQDGKPRVVFAFTISDGKITGIELLAEPERLDQLELKIL
jgi:RNA polymerase sigma factor (sigma-70 family)